MFRAKTDNFHVYILMRYHGPLEVPCDDTWSSLHSVQNTPLYLSTRRSARTAAGATCVCSARLAGAILVASGASGARDARDASGASGASGVSGASGASGVAPPSPNRGGFCTPSPHQPGAARGTRPVIAAVTQPSRLAKRTWLGSGLGLGLRSRLRLGFEASKAHLAPHETGRVVCILGRVGDECNGLVGVGIVVRVRGLWLGLGLGLGLRLEVGLGFGLKRGRAPWVVRQAQRACTSTYLSIAWLRRPLVSPRAPPRGRRRASDGQW